MTLAEAQLAAQEYRFAIARAELGQQVRSLFAFGIAVRDNLALARENEERARELSRIARGLVESGKEPPLGGLRAAPRQEAQLGGKEVGRRGGIGGGRDQ